MSQPAFTIGYGGRKPDEFARLLTDRGVKTLVDVRLRPDRASVGTYAKAKEPDKGIAGLLAKAGVGYASLPELGNLFLDYGDWPERYEKFLALAAPVLFDRLEAITGPVCLMCAEKKVCECHRRHIAVHLEKTKGWTFTHIE
ncbi:DUF488 domain-containing protein [Frigoriglobus tundricola]|uniref:DUF488 domain-containing protein n=1 Tax=Frigoriglobus tundricola TaxID=2774151 RepID=A0A6M5YQV5_9BACT|nr:DUF488 domain-containing protein [Frigoriglobus tundricola]QJW96328.1 hypothetical protein FTUN_3885 [Frigoriglobus tundricola]